MATKYIASIFPMEREHIWPRWQPDGRFYLPAVKRGDKPAILAVEDHTCPEYIGNGINVDKTIHAHEIAPSLVTLWTNIQYATGDACPGIWVIDIPGVSVPTVEDVLASQQYLEALEKQNQFAQRRVNDADQLAAQDARGEIINLQRIMCSWLGLVREWNEDYKSENLKACQFCSKNIALSAMKCSHCSEIVDYERYAKEKAALDDAVKKAKTMPPPLSPNQNKQHVAA